MRVPERSHPQACDYLVLGAGSAGCVLANRLSADSAARVLVLEAGTDGPAALVDAPGLAVRLQQTQYDWAYATVPQPELNGRSIAWPRGRAIGGSSVLNYMVYVRGHRGDYDDWCALGNSGWGYDDVLPYFRRAEDNTHFDDRYHGRGGPLGVEYHRFRHSALCHAYLSAAQDVGIAYTPDFNGERQEGCSFLQMTARNGRRCSADRAYLEPALHRPNLRVERGCRVTRLRVEGGRATGVEYIDAGGQPGTIDVDREVICALGVIGSPQLLLVSGIGPADELEALDIPVQLNLPGVGRNLQDHLGGLTVRVAAKPSARLFAHRAHTLEALERQYVHDRSGALATNHLEAGAFVREVATDYPDLQLFCVAGLPGDSIVRGSRHADMLYLSGYVGRPKSRGRITLESADPLVPPLIDPCYLQDSEDLALSIASLRRNIEIIYAPAFDAIRDWEVQPGVDAHSTRALEAYVRANASTCWHPTSTCRMGVDADAVVDPQLRVRGIDGLRVCDASIMPTLVTGNTNAPTIMIAEKGADLIMAQHELIRRTEHEKYG